MSSSTPVASAVFPSKTSVVVLASSSVSLGIQPTNEPTTEPPEEWTTSSETSEEPTSRSPTEPSNKVTHLFWKGCRKSTPSLWHWTKLPEVYLQTVLFVFLVFFFYSTGSGFSFMRLKWKPLRAILKQVLCDLKINTRNYLYWENVLVSCFYSDL